MSVYNPQFIKKHIMGKKIKSRTVSTLDKSHYCIWNPKFNLPLCYEGKVLVFTTESDAKRLADTHLTEDEYEIKPLDKEYPDGYIVADGLVIKRHEYMNGNLVWTIYDLLVFLDTELSTDYDDDKEREEIYRVKKTGDRITIRVYDNGYSITVNNSEDKNWHDNNASTNENLEKAIRTVEEMFDSELEWENIENGKVVYYDIKRHNTNDGK